MMAAEAIRVDDAFVSRLLLGALSEHEQRRLAAHLLASDTTFRRDVGAVVEPFRMFDLDLVERYARALYRHADDPAFDLEGTRKLILAEAFLRAPDLGAQIRGFTFGDVLQLGEITRSLFSWSMAEYLLARAIGSESGTYNTRTGLYLALMVIDVVDILGAAGHSPHYPAVVADVRRRIRHAHGELQS